MAENNAPPEAPAKKGKLKLILMLTVVIVLAVGLSVVGTMWFLGGGIPGMADAEQEDTTVQAEGRQRYAQVYLAFEAQDPAALAAANQHMPLLRSKLIGVLGGRDFNELQTPEGRKALADDMLATVNSALEQEGESPLLAVLFRNFVVQ